VLIFGKKYSNTTCILINVIKKNNSLSYFYKINGQRGIGPNNYDLTIRVNGGLL
jgi:hypothetical protein